MAVGSGPAYRARRPDSAPSQGSLADRDAFATLARQSLPEVRASAEAWRNGLTAFITLVTTGVIIKGRDTTVGMPTSWRLCVTVLIGGGIACAVTGLWRVLAAQAGTRYQLSTRQDLRRSYGSVEIYHIAMAAEAISKLNTGRHLVIAALTLLLAGVGVSWWAPTKSADSPAFLQVTSSSISVCGALVSTGNGQIRLAAADHRLITIPLTQITHLATISACK